MSDDSALIQMPAPWEAEIELPAPSLFNEVLATVKNYVVFQSEHEPIALTLWISMNALSRAVLHPTWVVVSRSWTPISSDTRHAAGFTPPWKPCFR